MCTVANTITTQRPQPRPPTNMPFRIRLYVNDEMGRCSPTFSPKCCPPEMRYAIPSSASLSLASPRNDRRRSSLDGELASNGGLLRHKSGRKHHRWLTELRPRPSPKYSSGRQRPSQLRRLSHHIRQFCIRFKNQQERNSQPPYPTQLPPSNLPISLRSIK